MNKYIMDLIDLHKEMGLLIKELNSVETDDGFDEEYYKDLVRDIGWDNKMLRNRLQKLKLE